VFLGGGAFSYEQGSPVDIVSQHCTQHRVVDSSKVEGVRVRGKEGRDGRTEWRETRGFHTKRELDSNLSGDEVYYTACSLPVIVKNLCSKLRCQKVLIEFSFHIRFARSVR
jgi:hypothetical protein